MPASVSHTIKLLCLPYAGGTAHAFKRFTPYLPSSIDLVPIDLPGHGPRLMEEPCGSLGEMVDHATEAILPLLNGPYALFGHSLGAQLAYLLAHQLPEAGHLAPLHLFVSGKAGPGIAFHHGSIHKLPREEFFAALRRFGGLPDAFFQDPEIIDLFEPRLRADFRAVDNYIHVPRAPLPLPITVFYGDHDLYEEQEFRAWEAESSQPVHFHRFPGNHFFFEDHAPRIARLMTESLGQSAQRIDRTLHIGSGPR